MNMDLGFPSYIDWDIWGEPNSPGVPIAVILLLMAPDDLSELGSYSAPLLPLPGTIK